MRKSWLPLNNYTIPMCSHKKHFVTTFNPRAKKNLENLLCTTRFYCCWMWPHIQSGSLDQGLWQHHCCFLLCEDFMVCFCMSYLCFLCLLLGERDPGPAASRTEHVFLSPVNVLKQVTVWLLASSIQPHSIFCLHHLLVRLQITDQKPHKLLLTLEKFSHWDISNFKGVWKEVGS